MGKVNKRLQDLDPKSFPHLEKKWIGGSIDLDLLSQILKNEQESWGESRERASSSKATMEEREWKNFFQSKVEEGLFIVQGEKITVGEKLG